MTVSRRGDRQAAAAAGIMRHIVGADRVEARRAAKAHARAPVGAKVPEVAKNAQAAAVEAPEARPERVSSAQRAANLRKVADAARTMGRKAKTRAQIADAMASGSWLQPWQPPKGVVPANHKPVKLAMDLAPETFVQGTMGGLGSWAGDALNVSFAEGIGFLGYSYLAALTQRAEYRRMSERFATEMTRKWIRFQTVNKPEEYEAPGPEKETPPPSGGSMGVPADPDQAQETTELDDAEATKERVQQSVARKRQLDKSKRIKELEDEMRRLRIKDAFYTLCEGDGWFGRYHLYLDFGTSSDDAEEMTPIGNGIGAISEAKVGIENGATARIGGARTKLVKRKLQAVKPIEPMWCYPANYNSLDPRKPDWYNPEIWYVNGKSVHRSRLLRFVGREVPDILKPAYAFGGLSMSQMAKPYVDNWLRTRQAVCDLIESFSVSGVYTNLDGVLEEGNTEALNRIEVFNEMRANAGAWVLDKDTEEFFNVSTPLGTLDALQAQSQEQMSSVSGIPLVILLGITPKGLNASSEGELRAFYDTVAAFQEQFFRDHLQTVINFVMLSIWGEVDEDIRFEFVPLWSMTEKEQAEVRKVEAETDGLLIDKGIITNAEARNRVANDADSQYHDINPADVPEMPEPDPMGGGDDPFGGGDDSGDGGEADGGFGAQDEWKEEDHPRADNGQFGSGGGGTTAPKSSGGSKSSIKPSATQSLPALNVAALKKTGGKLGSNEGGVYTDSAGAKFYVKKPKTREHVANEMAAARLYQLAGVNTLKYRDAGPDHVATEWESLDKNRIANMTPEERKAATRDFGVHAWLSNWDAAGTGGDNQGIRDGKPVTLDVGGSLRFRAQGGPKGAAFGPKVSEIDTMRNASMSPDAARLYGKMSDEELRDSVQRVTEIPDAKIRKAVGDDKQLADTLIARKQDLAKRFGLLAQDSDDALYRAALDAVGANLEEDDNDGAEPTAEEAAAMADDPGAGEDLATDADEEEPTEVAPDVFAFDEGQFDESKIKRDADGKFATKEGGGEGGEEGEKAGEGEKPKSKKEQIGAMLLAGTTPKELMQAMGWPSVSMPAQAQSLGMKLEKKDGKYFGIKMTDEELAAFKADQAAKKAAKGAAPKNITETETFKKAEELNKQQQPPQPEKPKGISVAGHLLPVPADKPETYPQWLGAIAHAGQSNKVDEVNKLIADYPEHAEHFKKTAKVAALKKQGVQLEAEAPKPKAPEASEADKAKAKKAVPLKMEYVKANAKPETATMKAKANELLDKFNEKWAGKEGLDNDALNEKVADFKQLGTDITKLAVEENKQKAELLKAEQEKAAWEQQEKLKAEKAALEEQFAKNPEMKTHYDAMEALFGGNKASGSYIESAKSKLKSAGLEQHLTPEEAVGVIAYTGSHYRGVNDQLRKGQMTVPQYKLMKSINAGLDKMPPYQGTTYRKASLSPEQFALYKPGMVVEERGFTSTSKNKNVWSGSHQYTVHGKSGRDVQKISNYHNEAEVLFKSGTRFYVEKVEGNHITLREL